MKVVHVQVKDGKVLVRNTPIPNIKVIHKQSRNVRVKNETVS